MAIQKRPRPGAWLLLVLFTMLMFLSAAVMLSRPTYADDSRVEFRPRLDKVEEPTLPPPSRNQSDSPASNGPDHRNFDASSHRSPWWKITLIAALGAIGLPMIDLLRRELKGQRIDWPRVKEFAWGAVKGIGKTALAILAVVALAALAVAAGVPVAIVTTALLILAAVFVAIGAGFSIWQRWKEQQAAGITPIRWKTVGVGVLDAVGVSGLIEGIVGTRLLTRESLDPEVAGESFGSGLVQVGALGVGARTFPKGLGRVSAVSSESLLSRLGKSLSGWWRVREAPEASVPGVWRILGAMDRGAGYSEVLSRLPAPLRTLTNRLIEARWLTLRDDGTLQGPAGKVVLPKVKEALITNNIRRLRNIFNNVKGGEAQLRVKQAIEHETGYKRFVADFRDPSAGGLDSIVEMEDGTFHVVEVKGNDSPVGPNDVHKILKYTPGKNGQPGKAEIRPEVLIREIGRRVQDEADLERIKAALRRGDGSVVLRIELVGTKPTGPLNDLNGQVIDGVKILIKLRP